MDNYFTLPAVMTMLRDKGIGVFRTLQFQRYWLPEHLKNLSKSNCNFNKFYHLVDEHGTFIARWMDNGLVFCVLTVHTPGKTRKIIRKQPQKTLLNARHIDKIFGDEGKKEISIPTLIDHYNYKMGGVDVADQRIAYYQPNVRCRRVLIPMFIQGMGIVRNNSFIAYKAYHERIGTTRNCDIKTHKNYSLNMISELLRLSNRFKLLSTVATQDSPSSTSEVSTSKFFFLWILFVLWHNRRNYFESPG